MPVQMEVFVPDELFDTDALQTVIRNTLTETAAAVKVDFGVFVQTWKHKPKFYTKWISNGWGREVYTIDDIFGYVNFGTRPHPIDPVKAPRLVFQWGGPGSYKSKTLVSKIMSRNGGPSGPIVYRLHVDHPGTEPRDIDVEIAEKWNKELPEQLQRAIDSEVDR